MPSNKTAEWGDKLAALVDGAVVNPPPAENAVNAKLTNIDGSGTATLVSKLKNGTETYDGFALVFKHTTNYENFKWLQFITRQLVVNDNIAKTGNLLFQTHTAFYQLVDSTAEITDYTFASGSVPTNWNTCWKVDSSIITPFYGDAYEYATSEKDKLTAILDAPSPLAGTIPLESLKKEYVDLPDDLVVMKDALGSNKGVSRAYLSDYLLKKEDGGKWRIFARFDFSLTWNPVAKDSTKKNSTFTLRSLKTTATTELLECHKNALLHKLMNNTTNKPTNNTQPWKSFYDSILL